jgi:hypothetical protein
VPPVRAIAQSLVDPGAGPPLSDAHAALLRALADLRGVRRAAPDPAAAQRYALAGGGAPAHPPAAVLALRHGSDPEYAAARRAFGAVEAYHGSALENFHCILRCGLRSFRYPSASRAPVAWRV